MNIFKAEQKISFIYVKKNDFYPLVKNFHLF